ncbi:MAG TPA: hypothetical protein VFR37_12715 [Longimicrobium sp.]|nr:hypothetical protein [Longimicrobium sp.]
MGTRRMAWHPVPPLLALALAAGCRDAPTAAILSEPSSAALSPAAPAYTGIDLGTLGGFGSWAWAVNVHGEVVGTGALADWGRNAFRWTAQGGMEDLGTLGGVPGEDVDVAAINDAGTIVGASSAPGGDYRRAFSLTRSGEWRDLGVLPGQQASHAWGINNKGEIIGTTVPDSRAFIYRPGTGMAPLQSPDPARTINMVLDINDSSQIVGRFWGAPHGAFIMKYPGEMQIISLDSLPYDDGATPVAINNAGQVVGYWGSYRRAFVWSAAEGMRFLPTPGVSDGGAFDIDEEGRIAGTVIDHQARIQAAVWTPDGAGGYTLTVLGPGEAQGISAGEVVGESGGRATLWSLVLTPQPPPAAPTDLALSAVSYCRMDLSWTDASTNESSFRVRRATQRADGSFGPYQTIGTLAAGSTAYSDTTVAPGATVRYQVQACNTTGCGTSDAAIATLPPLPAPASVRAAISAGRVVVAWSYASGGGAWFRVWRSARLDDGTFPAFRTIGQVGAGAAAFADSAVAPGHTYRYVVQACHGGECTSSASVPVDVPLRPAAPAGLSARAASGRRIDLAWTDASTNESAFLVRRTTRRPDGTFPPHQTVATLRAGSTAYADLAVEIGGVYHYRVAACNTSGCAFSSLPSSGVTVAWAPAAPTGVVARAVPAGRVEVGWTDASGNETSFRVQRSARRPDGTYPPFQTIGTVPAGATAFSDATVAGGSTYRYRAQACRNATCTSSASVPVTIPVP